MAKIDVVRDFLNREMDLDYAANVFSDDFQWEDSTGQQYGKDAYLGLGATMMGALPDLEYVVEDMYEEDGEVTVVGHWHGTFENAFDLSAMGVGVVPPNGQVIDWPTGTARWYVDGDRVTRIEDTSTGPDSGMAGFLKPLGVNLGG